MTRADRLEATVRLNASGHSDAQIADRLGVTARQVLRDRQSLGIPAVPALAHFAQYGTTTTQGETA